MLAVFPRHSVKCGDVKGALVKSAQHSRQLRPMQLETRSTPREVADPGSMQQKAAAAESCILVAI